MHAMGSRLMGFTQELFNDTADATRDRSRDGDAMAEHLPLHLRALHGGHPTTTRSAVGAGCDDQFEFEFALDLMLDGLERLKDRS